MAEVAVIRESGGYLVALQPTCLLSLSAAHCSEPKRLSVAHKVPLHIIISLHQLGLGCMVAVLPTSST